MSVFSLPKFTDSQVPPQVQGAALGTDGPVSGMKIPKLSIIVTYSYSITAQVTQFP